ncbi:hypothetical protein J18TS1_32070 [Oceanobacillus oncorhynchi subsp. incaldanensis]|uniref:Uncharacterized protein n=1 Tax=Oceanobacillus oncorhynchi TaxID=545501 RepID=A0A0A1MLZ6_9BACI|nr:hypothetical protein J18TS1_32070 [Oceanobacillus oncorhynchi subsp. incaldanensis]CEI80809.1 hypothetical protein BN997_00619 [Oceanobacillus oncorhynchi]
MHISMYNEVKAGLGVYIFVIVENALKYVCVFKMIDKNQSNLVRLIGK